MAQATADETNTKYAQGIAVVNILKSIVFEKHIKDALIAGDGLYNTKVVEIVVKRWKSRTQDH